MGQLAEFLFYPFFDMLGQRFEIGTHSLWVFWTEDAAMSLLSGSVLAIATVVLLPLLMDKRSAPKVVVLNVIAVYVMIGSWYAFFMLPHETKAKEALYHRMLAAGEVEDALKIRFEDKWGMPSSIAELNALRAYKGNNPRAYHILNICFTYGLDFLPKNPVIASSYAEKEMEAYLKGAKAGDVALLAVMDLSNLSKDEISKSLALANKTCDQAEAAYLATNPQLKAWADSFAKKDCIPVYNRYN